MSITIRRFAVPRFLVALLMLVALPAAASRLQVTATGTLSLLDDPGQLLFAGPVPTPGTPFVLTFSYDREAPDFLLVPDPAMAFYRGVEDLQLVIGDLPPVTAFADNFLAVEDQAFGILDFWQATSYRDDGVRSESFGMYLSAFCGCAVDSTALIPPIWPGDWESGRIYRDVIDLGTGDTLARVHADIDGITVVPAPAVGWLRAVALAGVAGRRSRRRRAGPHQ